MPTNLLINYGASQGALLMILKADCSADWYDLTIDKNVFAPLQIFAQTAPLVPPQLPHMFYVPFM